MSKSLPCFVLTIDPPEGKRRRNAEVLLTETGLLPRFVEGNRPDDSEIAGHFSKRANLLAYRRSLSHGEIAVYCGHRRIWRQFLNSGEPVALVVEDDFSILDRQRFRQVLADVVSTPRPWDVLKLFDPSGKPPVFTHTIGKTRIAYRHYPASGAVAYLITREAAQKLLTRQRFFRPVDEDLAWSWEFDIRVWSVNPGVVGEASSQLGGSLLESERRACKSRQPVIRSVWGNVLQCIKVTRGMAYTRSLQRQETPEFRIPAVRDEPV